MEQFKRETSVINCKQEELVRLLGLEALPAPYHYRIEAVKMLDDRPNKIVQFIIERTL